MDDIITINGVKYKRMAEVAKVSSYYLHDNHLFTRISFKDLDELIFKAIQIEETSPCGLLCPLTLLDQDGKELRRVGAGAISRGSRDSQYFIEQACNFRSYIEADAQVMQAISEGKGVCL